MLDRNEFERLKTDVEKTTRDRDKAQGALDQISSRLKKEYGCKTVEDAEKLKKETEKDMAKLAKQYQKLREEFDEKYQEKIET